LSEAEGTILRVVQLSAEQHRVVEYNDGALLVVAGPGTGKTRVLTERVRRLLTAMPGHFRVLALTFTNKAASEMIERLDDLGELKKRTFIGTLHRFCLNLLNDRGKLVGITSLPQIFERTEDRSQVLLDSVMAEPELAQALAEAGDAKERNKRLDDWLRMISYTKAHPITRSEIEDPLEKDIFEVYNSGLRACDAFDFEDLLLLTYGLLTDYPKVADFYRRLYRYICVDEAQDLNEAQYAVIRALCGDDFTNVMMVGDPKQAIYGFNTSSPRYMRMFAKEFGAKEIELTQNFRSSRAVVELARKLEPNYTVEGRLPIRGEAKLLVGTDEANEAELVVDELETLLANGHPDIEAGVTPSKVAILGRTRFSLLAVEKVLLERAVPFFKRLSTAHEYESSITDEFILALRVLANPKDRLHLAALAKKWDQPILGDATLSSGQEAIEVLDKISTEETTSSHSVSVVEAIKAVARQTHRLDLIPGIEVLRHHADALDKENRRTVYDDTEVLLSEWDQFLRSSNVAARTIASFLSSMALGITQKGDRDGVALLTVHSSKGLEFDVVFVVGMADGVFPDYRARGKSRELAEERRNAFVAITRSKRLLYISYPSTRRMPWGDVWGGIPSPYIRQMGFLT
jgi:DNA helicase-2/ATP-dependent DNA helicase PcrA